MAGCEDRDREAKGKKKRSNNGEEEGEREREEEGFDHREFFLEHNDFSLDCFQTRIKGERKGDIDDIVCIYICELICTTREDFYTVARVRFESVSSSIFP